MACDTFRKTPEQTLAERNAEIDRALKRLEQKLMQNQAGVVIASNGAIGFTGWAKDERDGVSDACAYRILTVQNSWALKQAVAKAQALSGRQVNPQAVAAGFHTHDGGKSWSRH